MFVDDPTGGDLMFQIVPIFIGIIFIIVIGFIIINIIKGFSQWSSNNQSPILIEKAKVVTKRTAVRGGGETRAYNEYYVTFQMDNGERVEFKVKDNDYGMLVEGDEGMLNFQGTRYLNFKRI
ncbi:DUF2500 domain-containing protein [Bacillus sp. 31A1R]|uniref:DUF2500 domain-containing protein n=1 Tax=Robertmurraya mangrovi TaxID=3098077 RepID=A0ABU5J0D4_9BACI|nr:DUF2500 domain-containing protein [Bacillus sp. 31A1R]MDZ5472810.1 DUF2500 domain-containing protein [Bacillus sp. 31A1R]